MAWISILIACCCWTKSKRRHDGNRDSVDNAVDQVRIRHPSDATFGANIRGNPLERHHGNGAGVLGDFGLFGRDDVHNDAAFEHVGKSALDARCSGLWCLSHLTPWQVRAPQGRA